MSHTTIECPSCEQQIEPGQMRVPTDSGPKHDYCELHDSLFDKYYFSILNSDEDGHSITLFRVYEGEKKEFPVINLESTATTVTSYSTLYSGASDIKPSEEFFSVIAYSVHSLMSYDPFGVSLSMMGEHPVRDEVKDEIDLFYDHKPPEHEVEAARTIVVQILPHSSHYVIPELGPIRDFAQECTQFNLPPVHPELE